MTPEFVQYRLKQEQRWEALPQFLRNWLLWPRGTPRAAWHSFDRTPWQHPWLTPRNIRRFREFSEEWMDELERRLGAHIDAPGRRYAFVGNMANNLYSRARGMKDRPVDISVYLHPHDKNLMSHPSWEEYDGEGVEGVSTLEEAALCGMALPAVRNVHRPPVMECADVGPAQLEPGMRFLDLKRYVEYFSFFPLIRELRHYDALLTMQSPFLAYLSGRNYVATQMGGDIWYEASRDDVFGRLQRRSFGEAKAFIVSNPWSLAFARRYGFDNLVYLPFLIDQDRYSPGPPECRQEWQARTGGDFFIFMSARLDYYFKGSDTALAAFAKFAADTPGARLVIAGWGADQDRAMGMLRELGIADRILVVPIAGKKRLIKYLRSADCLLDQLSMGYYGASALEGMACGVPVVINLNADQYDALIPEGCAPVCNAKDAQDVERYLRELHASRDLRASRGEALRQWFVQTHGNAKWGRRYDLVLAGAALGALPGFRRSPLRDGLAADELRYHGAELRAAPVFPQYH
jgi:glycosyltransferase involved in cell wall biosynthesis